MTVADLQGNERGNVSREKKGSTATDWEGRCAVQRKDMETLKRRRGERVLEGVPKRRREFHWPNALNMAHGGGCGERGLP